MSNKAKIVNLIVDDFRTDLADAIWALRRDYKSMSEEQIQYDLGYISALGYAINKCIDKEFCQLQKCIDKEFYQYDISEKRLDPRSRVRQTNRINRVVSRITFLVEGWDD